jgi:hypothetical protein
MIFGTEYVIRPTKLLNFLGRIVEEIKIIIFLVRLMIHEN